ncbi:MAG: DNA mismatch repair protein MutS [Firmicutes bacterium]|nr:DNA mismatch repair protein MutS [Bacillota bacterium]
MAEEKLSPMMSRYLMTKEEYGDCILFYRLGDFYEMFFDDAITASRELELTLTGKNCGLAERAPMCGVPFHSAAVYIQRLVAKGYKVAICEQLEDPKQAKGLVNRGVIRVVTPGTVIDETMLDEKNNNYLAIIYKGESTGLAFCDVSTGEVFATEVHGHKAAINELARYMPSEIIMNSSAAAELKADISMRLYTDITEYEDGYFNSEQREAELLQRFGKSSAEALALGDVSIRAAVFGMIKYLEHTQKSSVSYIDTVTVYNADEFMDIDVATRRNLEITETMRDKAKKGSLLWVLDRTKTSMGARKLKQWLEKPLVNAIEINKRLYSVDELVKNMMLCDDLSEVLSGIYDISRIVSRVSLNTANPKDLVSLKHSLLKLPELEYVLSKTTSPVLSDMKKRFDIMQDVAELLSNSISDDAPMVVKDGGVIKAGYNAELDELRKMTIDGKTWILSAEADERERTGIKNLKIGYNKIFGYYIEVTKSNLDLVPENYIRKQTLVNCERYITPKLKEMENNVLGASERYLALEAQLFDEIRRKIAAETDRLKQVCDIIATTDVLCSFAQTAFKSGYTMPEVTAGGEIVIKDGRHPVVEKTLKTDIFVPNDTRLDTTENREMIITGPNMAGKSTYMRQVALITLMAQVGSFVPASYAKIGVVDRIFTRVGASDDIAQGQSTFMLEMVEVSNILENATGNSLVILDEIGRGTSTFDGLSIAWAVAEYMQSKIRAKTLFATHYHELTQLEDSLDGVKNYSIAVKKHGDDITFLRKIIRGGADDSYGIEVAALAGVPKPVIKRAKEILKKIESDDIEGAYKIKKSSGETAQIGFEDNAAHDIFEELKIMDVTTFTPIEALNKLYELTKKAKE